MTTEGETSVIFFKNFVSGYESGMKIQNPGNYPVFLLKWGHISLVF